MEITTIKKQQATETGKKLFIDALDHLWRYYRLMYSDDSNELFDELHDSLFCQLDPLEHLADSGKITNGDLDEIHKLLIEVVDYYKASQKLQEPNWIYG